jgi:hypothetical protein
MRWLCLPRPSLSITNSMLCGAKPASSKRPSSLAWILRCATGRSMNIQALMLAAHDEVPDRLPTLVVDDPTDETHLLGQLDLVILAPGGEGPDHLHRVAGRDGHEFALFAFLQAAEFEASVGFDAHAAVVLEA